MGRSLMSTSLRERDEMASRAPQTPSDSTHDSPQRSAADGDGNRAVGLDVVALALLGLVTCITALSFSRVFQGWDWLRTLLVASVASHAIAYGCRRLRVPFLPAMAVNLAAGAVVLAHSLYPTSIRYGLPSSFTWDQFTADVVKATEAFGKAVPLVPGTGGYLAAAAAALWLAAFTSDTFAFRLRTTVEAIIPSAVLFVFVAAVASPRNRTATTAAVFLAAVCFIAVHRAIRVASGGGWLSGHRRGALVSLARTGVMLAAIAAAVGLLAGPMLPGAQSKALVDTRSAGDDTRYVVSPLVDIRKQISNRSNVELFQVTSNVRSYWRVTSLPDFDGRFWSSDLKQGKAKDRLASPPSDLTVTESRTTFDVGALGDIWMPAPYLPVEISDVSMKKAPKFDKDTATLLVSGELTRGDTYTITAAIPAVTAGQARAAAASGKGIDDAYLKLPSNFSPTMADLAREITAAATTPFDKMLALQTYFRAFDYNIASTSGQGNDAMERFINSREGYCEQFSGTFAAFARVLGVPARVAVGFTPGVFSNGTYEVQARHAHAWPEVHFDGLGWLAFEPTPGRGNPVASGYTNVPDEQDGEAPAPAPTTTVSPTTVPNTPTTTIAFPTTTAATGGAPLPVAEPGRNLLRPFLTLFGIVAVIGGYPLLMRGLNRRRWAVRRRKAATANDRVLVAWNRTTDSLGRSGCPPEPFETPAEFAQRAADELPIGREQIAVLAGHVTTALYGIDDLAEDRVAQAESVPERVERSLDVIDSRQTRLRRKLDPRPLLRPLPGDQQRRVSRFDLG